MPNYIDINIRKPLHGSKVYVRETYLNQAVREGKKLRITTGGITRICTPQEWKQGADLMLKQFKYPQPMRLWGNYVEEQKEEVKVEQIGLF